MSMKRHLFVLLILVLSAHSFTNTLPLPKESRLPNYKDYYDSSSVAVITKFYPIGWSKKGVFAYVTSFYSDATAKSEVTLVVLDLKTDRLISYLLEEIDADNNSAASSFWSNNADTISKLMNTYAIVMSKADVSEFPYNDKQEKLTVEIWDICRSKEIVVENFTKADTVNVFAQKGSGSKLLGSYLATYLCGTVEVSGYLKSPFEERIAVILTSWSPGWEGPPKTVSVMIRGCHLINGFTDRTK